MVIENKLEVIFAQRTKDCTEAKALAEDIKEQINKGKYEGDKLKVAKKISHNLIELSNIISRRQREQDLTAIFNAVMENQRADLKLRAYKDLTNEYRELLKGCLLIAKALIE